MPGGTSYRAELARDPAALRAAVREQNARWRAEHPGYNAAAAKKFRAEHADEVRASNREIQRRRREVIKAGERIVPLAVLEMSDGICGFCGEDVDPGHFEIDHVIPLAEGGWHGYDNVRVAHPGCNRTGRPRLSTPERSH